MPSTLTNIATEPTTPFVIAAFEVVVRFQPPSLDMFHTLGNCLGFNWELEEAAFLLASFLDWGWVAALNGRFVDAAPLKACN